MHSSGANATDAVGQSAGLMAAISTLPASHAGGRCNTSG